MRVRRLKELRIMKRFPGRDRQSIASKLRGLCLYLCVPLCCLCLFIFLLFLFYAMRYVNVSNNISNVSQFNQNFKDEVDLKMYYFVTSSGDEQPMAEVEEAKELATKLQASTTNRDSHRAINSVLSLCQNLTDCIIRIEQTDGYDLRMSQLENNVYVITTLIQEYMYTYLYHEAGEMATLREQMFSWLKINVLLIIVAMGVVFFGSARKGVSISRSITQPLDRLYQRVQEVGMGDLSERTPVQAQDGKLQALSNALEEMVTKLSQQMELNRQEQTRLQSMELALLQAQINPHFLYNTLDAIVWLIEAGKNDAAVEMVSSLSTYFRSFLSNGKEIISIREEILHVKSYLEIQQVRYKDILRYELRISPAIELCQIPKMTLQPLVENAIYHGIKPKRGIGTVTISGYHEDGYIMLNVNDNGVGIPPGALQRLLGSLESENAAGFGIYAVYQRLKLMYGSECSFWMESDESAGTTVHIHFPYSAQAEER